jgi:predicted CXXCH cytochrome family protein
MAGPAVILWEIHRLRTHARDLQSRIDYAPHQLKARQNAALKQEQNLHQAQDAIKKLKVATHEKEVSIKSVQNSIKKYEQQLNDITSKKEYDALKVEIAGAKQSISKLEDEALTLMTEVEDATGQLPMLEAELKKTKAEFAEFERDYQVRLDEWSKRRDEAVKQIAEVEAGLPKDIRPQYERLVKAMGADALSLVENRTCTACHTEITAQQSNNLRMQQFLFCRSCARLLYCKEEG